MMMILISLRSFIILLLMFCFFESFSQHEDSTIVTKFTDNFVEVKSTRVILRESYFPDRNRISEKDSNLLEGVVVITHHTPRGPVLENGIVVIKDRNSNILKMNYYNDSILICQDYFTNNILETQTLFMPKDTSLIEKNYYKNGKIKSIHIREKTGPFVIIDYSESGEIINKIIHNPFETPK